MGMWGAGGWEISYERRKRQGQELDALRQEISAFISTANKYGLPVNFLRYVVQHYSLSKTSNTNAAHPLFNHLLLSTQTVHSVRNMAPGHTVGETVGIQTIYHEATHAFLDLKSEDSQVSTLIKGGVAWYRNAPMANGTQANDPDRVFQEAAASYVGHRAAEWWRTLEMLHFTVEFVAEGKIDARQELQKIRQDYNQEMARRVFGYESIGMPWNRKQVETKRPIPGALKSYCDHVILEGKIHDDFSSNAKLRQMAQELVKG